MSRKWVLAAITFLLLISITSRVEANAYKTWAVGTKSAGKAAFIGEADDWTAIYWNPAGLTQIKTSGFSFEPGWMYTKQTDGNSAKNYDAINGSQLQGDIFLRIYNNAGPGVAHEPEQFDRDKSEYSGVSPASAFGAYVFLDPITIAFGVYTPAGLAIDWSSETQDVLANNGRIEATYKSNLKVTSYSVAAGVPLGENVSLGVGVNILALELKINAKKRYINTGGLVAGYDFRYMEDSYGVGVEPIIGIMGKINEKWQVGGVYRFGAKIQSNGEALGRHTSAFVNTNQDSPFRMTYFYPSSLGLGTSYDVTSKLSFNADWEYTNWRKLNRKIIYDRTDAVLANADFNFEWGASNNFAVGGEYKLFPNLSIRSGMRYDESPMSDSSVSMTNLIDVNKMWYTTGLAFKKGGLKCDVAYSYAYGQDTLDGTDYSVVVHNVMVSGGYSF